MPSLTADIKFGSPLHRRILDGVRDRIEFSKRRLQGRHKKWIEDEEKALAFLPEREADAKKRVLREDGSPQYTTIQIPYSYAILMASHTYWTTVFLSRNPVFQFAGRHGEGQTATQAVEALMDYQLQVGEMLVPLYIWLLDVGKYGVGVVGNFWEERTTRVAEIVEKSPEFLGIPVGPAKKTKRIRQVPGYMGNKLYNVRPFDFFPDPRVPMHKFQEGEFCGNYNEIGWNEILRREERGFYTNIDRVRGRTSGGTGQTGQREEGSPELDLPDDDEFFDNDSTDGKSSDVTAIFECYIEIVPDAWGLGKGKMPEKWVFTVTADYAVVLGAQPLGSIHDKFPFGVLEYEPEGYAIANRSIPEILEPIQNTLDWLINSHFYNVRKVLNDQFVVDPTRIVMKDLQDPLPGGIIRLAPSAYGTPARDAIEQLRVTDVTQTHLRDSQFMLEIGQRTLGVNDQILGALQQGGRKTATEVRTSSTFGINRLKTTAEYFSAMGWAPLSQMMLQNSQQYYSLDKQFRIVGSLAQAAGPSFINVNQESIKGFFDFVPVDGTLPVDRFAQANLWQQLMGQLRNFPELMAQYDMGRIFAWVAQLAGLKNIDQFRIQVVPDAQAQAAAQAGNVIPIPGSPAPGSNPYEPGQIAGLGPTG